MQYEHCGFCGFMGLTKMENPGMKKCSRCGWEGYPDRNTMEEMNKLAKTYRPGTKWAPPIKADHKAMTDEFERQAENPIDNVDAIEGSEESFENEEHNEAPVQKSLAPNPRLSPVQNSTTPAPAQQRTSGVRMSDADAYSSENKIDPNRTVSNKVPKNQELLDRLKGKNIKGADFL